MATERTLSIIKPDAVANSHIGDIIHRFETSGLKPVAMKLVHLSQSQAQGFYAEHEGKPFFDSLVEFMTSGPCVVQVLEGESAVRRHREILGATDPHEAQAGTVRADYAEAVSANAAHGSDSLASAAREIAYFFTDDEICPRSS